MKIVKKLPNINVDERLLNEAVRELDLMIGMTKIKEELHELVKIVRYHKESGRDVLKKFHFHTILVGNPGTVRTATPQKIIMMPSGSVVQASTTTTTTQIHPRIEQLDGAIDDLDGQLMDQDDDIESQISTVKIEKQTDEGVEGVKVTTSGNNEKIEENEAAAILSTISEQSHLSSHSVNTVIPLHDEK